MYLSLSLYIYIYIFNKQSSVRRTRAGPTGPIAMEKSFLMPAETMSSLSVPSNLAEVSIYLSIYLSIYIYI